MAELHFDATSVEPDNGIETVPAGWYNASIDESSNKPTKDGVNSYTQFRFNILDGQYKGRKLFARFNLKHTNAQTSEIAQRQLSALCHAAQVLQLSDTQQLHNVPMKVKVTIKKDEGYEPSNEIRSFKNINEVVDGSAPASTAVGAPPPPAAMLPPAQPWAQQQASAPVAAPPAAPPPVAPPAPVAPAPAPFPPAGWTAHPSAPGYYYAGQEVLAEADLRAKFAAPSAPTAPEVSTGQAGTAGGWQPPAGQQPWGQPGGAAPAAGPAASPAATAPHPAQGFAPPWAQPAG
jgi:hypothetical protein